MDGGAGGGDGFGIGAVAPPERVADEVIADQISQSDRQDKP
jgi:hypothetical protein